MFLNVWLCLSLKPSKHQIYRLGLVNSTNWYWNTIIQMGRFGLPPNRLEKSGRGRGGGSGGHIFLWPVLSSSCSPGIGLPIFLILCFISLSFLSSFLLPTSFLFVFSFLPSLPYYKWTFHAPLSSFFLLSCTLFYFFFMCTFQVSFSSLTYSCSFFSLPLLSVSF